MRKEEHNITNESGKSTINKLDKLQQDKNNTEMISECVESISTEQNKGKNFVSVLRSNLKYIISAFVMIVILALTFHFIFKDISFSEVVAVIKQADAKFIIFAVIAMFIYEICIAINTKLIIDASSEGGVEFTTALKTAFISFYFNNVTPSATGGQPMAMYYLHKKNVNVSQSSVLFILLAIFYNISVISFAALSFIFKSKFLLENLSYMKYLLILGYLVLGGMTLVLLLMIIKASILKKPIMYLARIAKKIRNKSLGEKVSSGIVNYYKQYEEASSGFIKHKKIVLYIIIFNLIQVFSYYQVSYFACRALGASTEKFWDIFALQSNLYIAAASVPTPGMVGVMEAGFITMFRDTLGNGSEVSAMLLTRIINLYGFMILAGIVAIYAFVTVNRRSKIGKK